MAGLLPVDKFPQFPKNVAASEKNQPIMGERGNVWPGEGDSLAFKDEELVHHHLGKNTIHHQDKVHRQGNRSVNQRRKDFPQRGKEFVDNQRDASCYNNGDQSGNDQYCNNKENILRALLPVDNHNHHKEQAKLEAGDQMENLETDCLYQPGDRVKSRIKLWEGRRRPEETMSLDRGGKETKSFGKLDHGRRVNQVQPFSLQDHSRDIKGDKNTWNIHEDPDHHHGGNHDHLNNHDLLDHHYHGNQDRTHKIPGHSNQQNHLTFNDSSGQGDQVGNGKNNRNQVIRYDFDGENSCQSQDGGGEENIEANPTSNAWRDEEIEQVCFRPKENLEKATSNKALPTESNLKQNQGLIHEPKGPESKTTKNIENSENEEHKQQDSQLVDEKKGWNSNFSRILGGQGGLGWVQGKHIAYNSLCCQCAVLSGGEKISKSCRLLLNKY